MIAAMKQALEALEDEFYDDIKQTKLRASITALRSAIEQAEQAEPVFAFRRKGLDDFCTCSKERYEELAQKPNLFEVAVFYAAPRTPSDAEIDAAAGEVARLFTPDYDDVFKTFARRLVRRLFGKE